MKNNSQTKYQCDYDGLLAAIDFFSQKFNKEQLSDYALDFASDLLGLEKICLLTKVEKGFSLAKEKGYGLEEYFIEEDEKIQHIATFYGSVMTNGFQNYFKEEDIEALDMGFMLPLIIQDHMHGFLFAPKGAASHLGEGDIALARALMQIINSSLENSDNFMELGRKTKKLDREVFNLFSINQSSKALLSVLELETLYQLAIDIFSEMTSSGVTSFGLYDDISGEIVIRGYKNVVTKKRMNYNFALRNRTYEGYRIVFHVEKDREALEAIFSDTEGFRLLEAEYVVLIVKDTILGLVTLGKTINDSVYDSSLFELIESLASATYISFRNAIYFNEITRQKAITEQKYNTLVKLNRLMKNLNSCESIGELTDLANRTIHIGFGMKKTLIALKNDAGKLEIKNFSGFSPRKREIDLSDSLREIMPGALLVEYFHHNIEKFLGPELTEDLGESNCLVISPIGMDFDFLDPEEQLLGYVMAFQTAEALKEEEVLLIDTISNSIAPTLYHMKRV